MLFVQTYDDESCEIYKTVFTDLYQCDFGIRRKIDRVITPLSA